MRKPRHLIVIGIVGMLLSVLGFVLWPAEHESRWQGSQRTQILVEIDGLPAGPPVQVLVWNGHEERPLGVTNLEGHVSGIVRLRAGGGNHHTVVDLYSERLVLRTYAGELLKIIPLESCTVRGGHEVTRPVHQVWIHVDYPNCDSLKDYWHYEPIENDTPQGE
jgi:hypothetical protein